MYVRNCGSWGILHEPYGPRLEVDGEIKRGGTGPLGGGLDTETKVLEDKARAGVAE